MNTIYNCFNCNSSQINHYCSVPDRHYGIQGTFNYSQCVSCKLVFLNPMPDAVELGAFYPEDTYYSYHADIYKKTPPRRKILLKLAFLNSTPNDVVFNSPGSVLDIGCGNGWNLYQYKEAGWQVAGVEPSKTGADIGNQAGLNIFNGDLIDARYTDESFDYIRLNHSFEHIHNPNEILTEIHRILKKDGKLFIGVPNIKGMNSTIFKSYWYYFGAPVHTFNYSPKTLSEMLRKNNFRNEQVNYNGNWAGILGSFQIYLNRKTGKTSDKGFFVNSLIFKMISGAIAKIQNLLGVGDCMEIIATKQILSDHKKN